MNKERAAVECYDILSQVEAMINNLSNNILDRFDEHFDKLVKDTILQSAFNVYAPTDNETNSDASEETDVPVNRHDKMNVMFSISFLLCLVPLAVFVYLLFNT